MKSRRVYVTQFGCTWSLSRDAWRRAVEAAVAGHEFNYDKIGKRLSRQRSKWDEQHNPLDWDEEQWTDELDKIRSEEKS